VWHASSLNFIATMQRFSPEEFAAKKTDPLHRL
jgi:hypothetical protein